MGSTLPLTPLTVALLVVGAVVVWGVPAILQAAVHLRELFFSPKVEDPVSRKDHDKLRDEYQRLNTDHAVLSSTVREQLLPLVQETRAEQHEMHRTLARLVIGIDELRRSRGPRIYNPPDDPGPGDTP